MDETSGIEQLRDAPVTVVSPVPLTSVTIEREPGGGDEIHVHPAGQGYWVARMISALGVRPLLVSTCGGETAAVAARLVGGDIALGLVDVGGTGGVDVDVRRSGERRRIAQTSPPTLDRHSVDDLVSMAVAGGLRTGIAVLTGSNGYESVPASTFTTLSAGLGALGVTVVVDASDTELRGGG